MILQNGGILNTADFFLYLGELYWKRGDLETSEIILSQVISSLSMSVSWRMRLLAISARLQLDRGDLEGADVECTLARAWIEREGDNVEFREDGYRGFGRVIGNLDALLLLRRGDVNKAVTTFADAERLGIEDGYGPWPVMSFVSSKAEIREAIGALSQGEDELRVAIEAWRLEGSRWSPDAIHALAILARILVDSDRCSEAAEVLAEAERVVARQRKVDPNPRTIWQLARLDLIEGDRLARLGDRPAAATAWREALRLLDGNPEGSVGAEHHLVAGQAWLRLGRRDLARPHASRLAELGWGWPDWVPELAGELAGDPSAMPLTGSAGEPGEPHHETAQVAGG